MSSVVTPIILLPNGKKMVTVAVAIPSGKANGTAQAPGLDRVEQILSAYNTGTGTSVAGGGGYPSAPFINPPNIVGASVNVTSLGNLTVNLLVQGS